MSVAFFELLIGLADVVEVIDFRDRDLELAFVDEIGQFGEDAGFGACGIAIRFDVVFFRGFEVDDRIDAFGFDT